MDEVDTRQLHMLAQAFNELRTSSPGLNGEPPLCRLYDPPGKALIRAYLQARVQEPGKTVLYAEVPPHDQRPSGESWLLKTLLQQWGDPVWDKRDTVFNRELRLKALLNQKANLAVVADIHLLGFDTKASRYLNHLLSLFQTGAMMPLVLVGEARQMNRLIATDARFVWRFELLSLEDELV